MLRSVGKSKTDALPEELFSKLICMGLYFFWMSREFITKLSIDDSAI